MMEIVNNFQSGFRNGIANNGHVVYCRYGLPHLVCLPINRPDDPLLSPALSHLKAMNGYYAQQFFIHLSDSLNSENVISNLYQYATQSTVALADHSKDELIEEISLLVTTNKLLIIPLYE
ncbi:hypothetical protein CWB76_04830 [Pseudoalteromonas sp. S1609]|uniref:hypothetical protein n=1 Tax=Pseudoalteromonas sp. S1609 TaxID=579505 RepID=UPI00110A4821|nr:hypothetical protein [Pseudoalteromonas sp. S1609]TMP72016.1 hypothetical protein CWB76_04830 [Pseudoalteromonas sp. S1609]